MGLFTQIIILIAVLASMFMVLLAIRQLARFEHFDDEKETENLKHEVKDNDRIVSHNSIFHNLVDTDETVPQVVKKEGEPDKFSKSNVLSKKEDSEIDF